MATYIIRRILWGIVLIILVSALTFVLFNVFPSADPAQLRAGRNASPATIAYIATSSAWTSRSTPSSSTT